MPVYHDSAASVDNCDADASDIDALVVCVDVYR